MRTSNDIRWHFTSLVAALSCLTVAAASTRGAVVSYSSQASFIAAAPGLRVDDFPGATSGTHSSPVSSTTNDAILPSGSIFPGLTLGTLAPVSAASALIVSADGIGTSTYGDTIVLSFSPGVTAVGAAILGIAASGQTNASNFTVDVYNGPPTPQELTFNEAANASSYFGVTSTTPITSVRILFNYEADAATYVNNIAFGNVPEASSIALLATGGLFALRRRPKAAPSMS